MKPAIFLAAFLLFTLSIYAQDSILKKPIQLNEKDLIWNDGPLGSKISVLEGNPKSDSIYTIRLKMPAGFIVKPHWHLKNERVTILSGSVYVGLGNKTDKSKSKKFTAGAYYVNPPDLHHYVWTDEPAEIQITGIGPWVVNYVENER